jgi:ABC-2 type transport system permease protein
MSRPLVELTRTRVLEFVREPGALFWVFIFPVLLAVALGIAFRSRPPEPLRVAVVGAPAATAWATAALAAAPGLEPRALDAAAAARALRTGDVDLVVDVEGVPAAGDPAPPPHLTYRFDASRAEGRAARLAADDALQRALGRVDPAAVAETRVSERGARYIDFLLPGLIGLNLMGSGMWGIGFALVHARTRKLLKRFAATSMRHSDFLLAFGLSRLLFMALELVALIAFGRFAFGVVVHGSILDLVVVSLAGAAAFAALALLIAARPRSIEAASGWMNFAMLPMWVLSGSFFATSRFPPAFQPWIRALPLTALNDALRAVMNDGAPLAATLPQLAVLAAWGVVCFVLALRLFRWQ